MANKEQLLKRAKELNLEIDESLTNPKIQELIDVEEEKLNAKEDDDEVPSIFDDPNQPIKPEDGGAVAVQTPVQAPVTEINDPLDGSSLAKPFEPAMATPVVPMPVNQTPTDLVSQTTQQDIARAQNTVEILNLQIRGQNSTLEKLSKQEKVIILVPLSETDKPDAIHHEYINGVDIAIPKGKMMSVPMDVAKQYMSRTSQSQNSAIYYEQKAKTF